MTTLPQTTPIRLPRPAGSQPLAVGAAAPVAISSAQSAALQMTGWDIWRVIRAHMWLIIIMVAVGTGVGYVINDYVLEPYYSRYSTMGLIQLQPPASSNPLRAAREIDLRQLAVEQRTQAQLLRHEALFTKVLQNNNSEIRNTAWYKKFNGNALEAKKDLQESFGVSPILDSKLIAVSFSSSMKKDCKVVIEEIVNQHIDDQLQINRNKQYDRSVLLNNLKIRYQMHLRDVSTEVREKSVKLNIDGMGTAGRISAKENELSFLVQSQLKLQMTAAAAKAQLDRVSAQLAAGIDPQKIVDVVDRDPNLMDAKRYVTNLQYQYADLAAKLPEGHQQLRVMQARVDSAQAKFDQVRQELLAAQRVALLDDVRTQSADTQASLDRVTERVKTVKAEMGELSNAMATYLTSRDEESSTRELLKQVDRELEQIAQINNQQDLSGVSWATKPQDPDIPSFPIRRNTLLTGALIGLALSLGIAFLRELLDTSVRSPRDIHRVGQMSLLGMIPHEQDDPQSAGARLPLVIFEAPHSIMAEQFRQVRTRLQHAASLDTTRSIQVTGPSPGDGMSTVAVNLAAGLALNGRRILLVDGNFRRPELHKIFAFDNNQGFSDALNSIDTFESAVHETQVPNLAVMTSGPKPTNPTELLESQLLIEFIERALEEFDHVVFDSGPLLFASESMALAPRVDGVVTVVRARNNSRGVLTRMRDALRQVKAEHLGVVLNGVRALGGGYYGRNIKTYYEYQNEA